MTGNVVVVGSANADLVVEVPRRPQGGETLLGGELQLLSGGKGANQAAAAALSGAHVSFIGCVGEDAHGTFLLASLGSAGVNTESTLTSNRPTGTAIIFLTPDGENSIVVSPGANHALTIERVSQHSSAWHDASVVALSLEIPLETVAHVVEDATEHNTRIVLNAAPATKLSTALLRRCDPLIVNEHEALEVLGSDASDPDARHYEKLAQRLLEAGAQSVLITLGSAGVVVATPAHTSTVPAFTVDVIDTTGAGDAFVGAVAGELARGISLHEAVNFAQAMAALSVGRLGAQTSYRTRAEVESFISFTKLSATIES